MTNKPSRSQKEADELVWVLLHKEEVRKLLEDIIEDLIERKKHHDDSKLSSEEFPLFSAYSDKNNIKFGSEEYNKRLKLLKPAIDHHYKVNRHHPEHFENGIQGMNLVDIMEMFSDWYASAKSHNGDIYSSIEYSQQRFQYSDDIKEILINTAKLIKSKEKK